MRDLDLKVIFPDLSEQPMTTIILKIIITNQHNGESNKYHASFTRQMLFCLLGIPTNGVSLFHQRICYQSVKKIPDSSLSSR